MAGFRLMAPSGPAPGGFAGGVAWPNPPARAPEQVNPPPLPQSSPLQSGVPSIHQTIVWPPIERQQ